MSASNSVLPTTARVYAAISRDTSSVAPSRQRVGATRGVRRHGVGVGGDARAVKGGLRETALPQVELVLAREEPLAEQHLRALEAAALVEEAPVRDEHVADAVGVAHEHHRLSGDAEAGDVAVAASEIGEERERTPDHGERELAGIALARTGDGERRAPALRLPPAASSEAVTPSSAARAGDRTARSPSGATGRASR